jgi:hypothetical protein
MPEITCPSCGNVANFDRLNRDASEFCPVCDYPLFWARSTAFASDLVAAGDIGLRRLPGTAGHTTELNFPCPACSEPNPVTGVLCIRCGAELHPQPVAPPPPPPLFVPPPPPPPPVKQSWWPVIITMLVVAAIAVLVWILVH